MLKEISASHNQKKKLLRAIADENVIFLDDNGDAVIHAASYSKFVERTKQNPLDIILGIAHLAEDVEYLVIS